jgi:flagellar hook-basal body complex protein FliE
MAIQGITPNLASLGISKPDTLTDLQSTQKSATTSKSTGASFDSLLNSLNQSQNNSDALIQKLAAGEDVDLHQVMIATEQADISMRVALAIRDKLVDSYREVMRMSV